MMKLDDDNGRRRKKWRGVLDLGVVMVVMVVVVLSKMRGGVGSEWGCYDGTLRRGEGEEGRELLDSVVGDGAEWDEGRSGVGSKWGCR